MQSNEVLVSVIIPAFKADNYLPQALESVRKQTFRDWEIIVVQDGSKDNTPRIVQAFKSSVHGQRVDLICHKRNKGLSAARNTAIRASRGRYIALLDHDDVWESAHLESAVALLGDSANDLVYSTARMLWGNECIGYSGPTPEEIAEFPKGLFLRNFILPSSSVIRRKVFDAVGYFDEDLKMCEDYDFWIRMVKVGCLFRHSDSVACNYRRHESAMANDVKSIEKNILKVLNRHKDWQGVPDEVRLQGIRIHKQNYRSAKQLRYQSFKERVRTVFTAGILKANVFTRS